MPDFVAAIDRHLPATPERVYAAWTEPALLAKWVWAGIGGDETATTDLRVGGDLRVCTQVKGEPWCFRGTYEVLEPPAKLRFSLVWEADVGYPPGTEHIEVTLTPADEGTHMSFRHSNIPDAKSVEGHTEGWDHAFKGLAALLLATS